MRNPRDGDAEQLVTTAQACALLGEEVTPALIQNWVRRGLLVPKGRIPGGSNVFRTEDVVEAEYRTRAGHRGRPRRREGRSLPPDRTPRTISEQTPLAAAARRASGLSRCTVIGSSGRDCRGVIPTDSPITACLDHLREAYLWFSDHLQQISSARPPADVLTAAAEFAAQPMLPAQPPAAEGVIYYVRFGDRIKIGHTTQLRRRLTALPFDEVMAIEPGPLQLEKVRHRQFAAALIAGKSREWFDASSAELQSHIAMLRGHYGRPDPRTGDRLPDGPDQPEARPSTAERVFRAK